MLALVCCGDQVSGRDGVVELRELGSSQCGNNMSFFKVSSLDENRAWVLEKMLSEEKNDSSSLCSHGEHMLIRVMRREVVWESHKLYINRIGF